MRDWDVTHPGFASSVQGQPINHTKVCKDVKFLESDSFYNPGEKKMSVEYFIDDHVLPAKETIYEDVRFNFPVCCSIGLLYYLYWSGSFAFILHFPSIQSFMNQLNIIKRAYTQNSTHSSRSDG